MKTPYVLLLISMALAGQAWARDVDCTPPPMDVASELQDALSPQFDVTVASLIELLRYKPIPECGDLLPDEIVPSLVEAASKARIEFVRTPLFVCNEETHEKRTVDMTNTTDGHIRAYAGAWTDADSAERLVGIAHELLGVAGFQNEEWNRSSCWAVQQFIPIENPVLRSDFLFIPSVTTLAGGGSSGGRGRIRDFQPVATLAGGGSSGGRGRMGGGSFEAAALKIHAVQTLYGTNYAAGMSRCLREADPLHVADVHAAAVQWILAPLETRFDPGKAFGPEATWKDSKLVEFNVPEALMPHWKPSAHDVFRLTLNLLFEEHSKTDLGCVDAVAAGGNSK
jgi:hypothetical protein